MDSDPTGIHSRISGRPGGTRTPNLRFWRPLLCQIKLLAFITLKIRNYLPPPYTIFGKGEENSSRNEVETFWLRLGKVEMAAWIRA